MTFLRSLCLALALALPASAQVSIPFQTVQYTGSYQGTVPGGVLIQTSSGQSMILPQGLSFTVGGTRVDLGGLSVGSPLQAVVPGGTGQVLGVAGDLVALQTPYGALPVPVGSVPGESKVTVLKKNGKTVTVPWNAALNMQRSQGAVILGSAGAWNGSSGPVVVLGPQGENLLLSTGSGFYTVPRSRAGSLGSVAAGRPVVWTGSGVEDWNSGKGKGKSGGSQGKAGNSGKGKGRN